jgi:hypothetical protein
MTIAAYPHPDGLFKIKVDQIRALTVYGRSVTDRKAFVVAAGGSDPILRDRSPAAILSSASPPPICPRPGLRVALDCLAGEFVSPRFPRRFSGTVMPVDLPPISIHDFERRISRRMVPEPNSGCWLWLGATDGKGYALIKINNTLYRAHRVSYALYVGNLVDGLVIDHKCRVRCCLNPYHLEQVTNLENIARGIAGENMRIKDFCPRGHPYVGSNLTVDNRGARVCRECNKQRCLAWRQRARSS